MDVLEEPPDLLTVIEAPQRQKATENLIGLLDSVDGMIDNLHVMPVQEPKAKRIVVETGKRDTGCKKSNRRYNYDNGKVEAWVGIDSLETNEGFGRSREAL